ncbi:peptidase M15 [Lacihabitans sp. CCS-44]|uniref:M15 family metallopeptidase n=1 Tax=Lacihabitans sp. CCS-44 TaxID=2487331 RepID=UPI0020CE3E2C|nr:M15 family metallopeptidase [Lacihabitans sp. CCS-44]MCP9753657.1 peptidase M15 [Lacihabitans sp. CCS-44]
MSNNSILRYSTISSVVIMSMFLNSCANKQEKSTEQKEEKQPISKIITPEISELEISMQDQGLVNIQELDHEVLVDLKYSSTDNFFGEDVYGILENAYLQKPTAEALKEANQSLKVAHPNLRLLVYDAARPLSIQAILWEKLDTIPPRNRKNFVADPKEGSIHNYGCAVDLTLFDLTTDQALDMGTKYDYFGPLAYPRLEERMLIEGKLTSEQIANRRLLRDIMQKSGFDSITSEWWHFNYYSRKKAKELYEMIQ